MRFKCVGGPGDGLYMPLETGAEGAAFYSDGAHVGTYMLEDGLLVWHRFEPPRWDFARASDFTGK